MKRVIDSIKKAAAWTGQDGLLHGLASLAVFVLLAALLPFVWALVLTLLIGVAKEVVWDRLMKKGQATWHDIICDAGGLAAGIVIYLLF